MCGIAGMMSYEPGKPVDPDDIRVMCDAMVHRGPDDSGIHVAPNIGMGMRRLSIIDLRTGHQPLTNEDGSVIVVFNGEIYNFLELRRDLERRGHVFATSTDTEVIVHLYEDHGVECFQRMRGMFAIAIWDERTKTLVLARDRLGIKPLYYAETNNTLAFASELKSILAVPWVNRELDWGAVECLFATSRTPHDASIVAGVRKLEPGRFIVAKLGSVLAGDRYWNLEFRPDYSKSEDDFVAESRSLLAESVRLHMVSDVPVGAFLSGGVDSSAIVALAAQASPGRLKTFSIGFNDKDYDELHYARIAASAIGAEHTETVLDPDVLGCIDDVVWHLDEPFGDSSAIPTYLVSKMAGQHVKVVLSGDGGDELFAGYSRYRYESGFQRFRWPRHVRTAFGRLSRRLPEGIRGRRFMRRLSLTAAERYIDCVSLLSETQAAELFMPDIAALMPGADPWAVEREYLTASGHWLSNLQRCDLFSYLPLDILTKVDRMSMAHSIESRVPLLDHVLVEFAATIPPEYQMRGPTSKYILKKTLKGIVPDAILDRPKRGFAIPLGRWFHGRFENYVRDLLLSDRCRSRGIFNPVSIQKMVNEQDGRDLALPIWTLITFELWCRMFLDYDGRMSALRSSYMTVPC